MSNMLRIKGLGFVRGGVAIALLGVLAMAHPSDDLAPASEPKPKYAPGVLIVKFKEPVADQLKEALVRGEPLHEVSLTPSLDALNAKYGVNAMRMLFSSFQVKDASGNVTRIETMSEHVARVRKMFPLRAQRSAAAYAGPDLTVWFKLSLDPRADIGPAAEAYGASESVDIACPDFIMHANWHPNDFYYNYYDLHHIGSWGQPYHDLWALKRINCESAWDVSRGAGVVIAVIDSGVYYRAAGTGNPPGHPDLAANIWRNYYEWYGQAGVDDDGNGFVDDKWGWNFVEHPEEPGDPDAVPSDPMDFRGHGTHVAGTAAAIGNNTIGVVGVAPQAKVMSVKVLNRWGEGLVSWVVDGIEYAVDTGADVLNLSLGGYVGPGQYDPTQPAVDYAWWTGCVVVCAAGNSNDDTAYYSPAGCGKAIAVSATRYPDQRAAYSNWGVSIDVAAPGGGDEDILSVHSVFDTLSDYYVVDREGAGPYADYYRMDGTSMAGPHVSGLAALVLSYHGGFTPEQVRQAIRKSAVDLPDKPGFDEFYGHGRIDAAAAMTMQAAQSPCSALITYPERDGQTFVRDAAGRVEISGVAQGYTWQDFNRFQLQYRLKEVPLGLWVTFAEGYWQTQWPYDSWLGDLYYENMPDGQYLIRLRVENDWGVAYDDYISVFICSTEIELPCWAISTPLIAELDLASPGKELACMLFGRENALWAFHATGGLYWNSPAINSTYSSPASAELDPGRPGPEIAVMSYVGTNEASTHVRHADSSPLWQWTGQDVFDIFMPSPAIGELVQHPAHSGPEVVFGGEMGGKVHCVFGDDGTPAWPSGFQTDCPFAISSSPTIADIDPASPGPEVTFGDFYGNVYVVGAAGQRLRKFVAAPGAMILSSPAVANLDANPADLEIVVGSANGLVYAFRISSLGDSPWWSYNTGGSLGVLSSPVIADLDPWNPGNKVVVGSDSGSVYCLSAEGGWYWRFDGGAPVRCTPAIAELDPASDGPEIVVGTAAGRYYMLSGPEGQALWAFATDPGVWGPLREEYGPFAPCPPVVGDIRTDLDGLEMVIMRDWTSFGLAEAKLYILNFPGTGPPGDMPWPMFQGNAQHTGYYPQ